MGGGNLIKKWVVPLILLKYEWWSINFTEKWVVTYWNAVRPRLIYDRFLTAFTIDNISEKIEKSVGKVALAVRKHQNPKSVSEICQPCKKDNASHLPLQVSDSPKM